MNEPNNPTIRRMPTHCGDETCASCVVAGNTVYLAHHAGGFDKADAAHQARAAFESINRTLAAVGGSVKDVVQVHLYLKDLKDFGAARAVFNEFFEPGGFPARMTSQTAFLDNACLCMLDGVAVLPMVREGTL